MATCPVEEIPTTSEKDRKILAQPDEIEQEVTRRVDPDNYINILGKSLKDVKDDITRIGRPLAPQSIEALENLLADYDPAEFDEEAFVQQEADADSRLYRDPRFRQGLIATLEQKIGDYREAK